MKIILKPSPHLLVFCLFFVLYTCSFSQSAPTPQPKGEWVKNNFSLGYGAVPLLIGGSGGYSYPRMIGPMHFRYEYRTSDFGIGLSVNSVLSRRTYQVEDPSNPYIVGVGYLNGAPTTETGWVKATTSFILKVFLHHQFPKAPKFDFYGHLGLGVNTVWNSPKTSSWPTKAGLEFEDYGYLGGGGYVSPLVPPIAIEPMVGARYALTRNFGFYAEAGLGKSLVQGGVWGGF